MIKSSLVIKFLCLNVALFIFGTSNATIWRVNNQSTSSAVFTTVQAAIDDDRVFAGDTILIEGSSETYSGFTVDKRIVFLSTGYFLNENPKTSAEGITAFIRGTVTFNPGSEGSILQGVTFSDGSSSYAVDVDVNDISLMGCYFTSGVNIRGRLTGLLVLSCYFQGGDLLIGSTSFAMQGTVFKNNIVASDFTVPTIIDNPRTFAAVENNLFLGSVEITTSTYRNNIWLPLQSETISVNAGIKEYNVNISVDMGAENNNSVITNSSELYTGVGTTDGRWQIKDDSAYKNAGKDGTDPGPFGGSNPYVLSGLPSLPIIYEISTTGFGSTEEGLPISIKVRSN